MNISSPDQPACSEFFVGQSKIILADAFSWLNAQDDGSIDAVVTDPPYGVKEYETKEINRMREGGTGIWRLPPSFDGNTRSPLPRFTALDRKDRDTLQEFFVNFSELLNIKLKPGAHVFMAGNSFLSQLVFSAMCQGGLEFRTEVIRIVQTLRGGDRPKLAENEFSGVCSLPRGSYEPWGLFRRALPEKMTVRECLRTFNTGGLRRLPDGRPFSDVIRSERTPQRERKIADHPSLKPQSLMRQLVWASLPLGTGVVVDPFAGSGSTIAAAESIGYRSIGIERHQDFFDVARVAAPQLAALKVSSYAQASLDF